MLIYPLRRRNMSFIIGIGNGGVVIIKSNIKKAITLDMAAGECQHCFG